MNRLFLLCALLILAHISHAQFFALDQDTLSPYVTVLPYPMDGNYRVLKYDHSFPVPPVHRASIQVFDTTTNFVKTIYLLKGINLLNDYPPLVYNKRLLWPVNYNDTTNYGLNYLAILELDSNYKFVTLHKISSHQAMAKPSGLVAFSTGFVVGEYFTGPAVSNTGFSTKVYKLNLNLQKRDSAYLADELRLKTHTSKNNKIVGASDNISSVCTPTAALTQKIVLDTNLVINDCYNTVPSVIYFCYDGAGNLTQRYAVNMNPKGIVFPISNYRTYIQGEVNSYSCPASNAQQSLLSGVFTTNTNVKLLSNSFSNQSANFLLYAAADCDYYQSSIVRVATIGLNKNYPVKNNF